MNNIFSAYNPTANFWEVNPQFTTTNPFRKLWKSDKSRGKKASSDLMWVIALVHHPKSEMYYIPMKEFKIVTSMLKVKDKEVDAFWEDNKELVNEFIDSTLTEAEKSLLSWEKRMKQRDDFLSVQKYHFGYVEDGIEFKSNTKDLDDMNGKTAKFYAEYFKIKESLEEQDIKDSNGKKGYSSQDVDV